MSVTEAGIVIVFIDELLNAPSSIDVHPDGILSDVMPEHSEKAPVPITFVPEFKATEVLPAGITKSFVYDAL